MNFTIELRMMLTGNNIDVVCKGEVEEIGVGFSRFEDMVVCCFKLVMHMVGHDIWKFVDYVEEQSNPHF